MLFVTDTFLAFFIVTYLLYWALPKGQSRMGLLSVASLVFYASWSLPFTGHLLAVVAINYYVMQLWRRTHSKPLFIALQTANILNIVFFKYFYFLADAIGVATGQEWLRDPALQLQHRAGGYEIFLPLAISFYTFQIMAYGIDIYRGVYTRQHTFREVVLFKIFFPQLIAGPIMRSSQLLGQISDCGNGTLPGPSREMFFRGLWLVLAGVVKKVLVADQIAIVIAPLLASPASLSDYSGGAILLFGFVALLMLYADFSAYSDLARGFGALLGFEIPINFKAPFFMRSLSDFWRRWHITFSLWIRDYIYIPLGGSRVPELRSYLNLTFTFFIGGLWHGAAWNFVFWGVVMGVWLSLEGVAERRGIAEWPARLPGKVARVLVSWIFLILSALFFFAPDMVWLAAAYVQIFTFSGGADLPEAEMIAGATLLVLFFHIVEEKPEWFARLRRFESWLLPLTALVVVVALTQFAGGPKDFFYFQF